MTYTSGGLIQAADYNGFVSTTTSANLNATLSFYGISNIANVAAGGGAAGRSSDVEVGVPKGNVVGRAYKHGPLGAATVAKNVNRYASSEVE